MMIFILKLINLTVFFRFILGYDFRKQYRIVAVGMLLIAIDGLLRIIYYENMPVELDRLVMVIAISLPLFFIDEKVRLTFGWSLILKITLNLSHDFLYGTVIVLNDGDLSKVNPYLIALSIQVISMLMLGVASVILRTRRDSVNRAVRKMKFWWFVPFAVGMILLRLNSYYSGDIDENMAQVIHALNMRRNGLLGLLTMMIFIMMLIIINQKRNLHRMVVLNERCIEEQTVQYHRVGERDQELRRFRHDYNRHIIAMQSLLKAESYEQLNSYIEELVTIKDGFQLISTNNIICDAILNQYNGLCTEADIELIVSGKLPDKISIKETDFCVILSNGIENAFEATKKCAENRKIIVDIFRQSNMLFVEIKNPTLEKRLFIDENIGTSKADSENHGYGVKIMKKTAMRCGGDVSWRMDEEQCVLTEIVLPLPI